MARAKDPEALERELDRDLERGEFRPAYLLFGREAYRIRETRERLCEGVLAGGIGGGFNRTVLVAARTRPEEVRDAVRTVPMLGGKRLVVVEWIDQVEPKKKREELHAALHELVVAAVPTTVLVMTAQDVDRRRKLYKAVTKTGLALDFRVLWGRNLSSWVDGEARRLGKRLAHPARSLLIDLVGNDLGKLHNELQKLVYFVGDRDSIELDDAERAVADLKISTIYELTEALGKRDLKGALLALHKLDEQGTAEVRTLWLVGEHFRQLLTARNAQEQGLGAEEACLAAGVRKNVVWKVKEQLRHRDGAALRKAMLRIVQTDDELRRSRVPPRIQLDRLAMDLCR